MSGRVVAEWTNILSGPFLGAGNVFKDAVSVRDIEAPDGTDGTADAVVERKNVVAFTLAGVACWGWP